MAHPQGFVVPAGNAGLPRPEIWSLGWRNPWKFSFDSPARGGTGAMLVADVGQDAWEEIDYEPAGRGGRNYGWRVREGAHPVHGLDHAAARRSHLRLRPRRWPIDHRRATSTVALRSRRCAAATSSPTTRRAACGRYAARQRDDRRGVAVDAAPTSSSTPPSSAAATVLGGISAFGVDAAGELYIVNHSAGTILKVVTVRRAPAAPTNVRIVR